MLDIKFIKENREIVETACKNKKREVDVGNLLTLYEKKTELRRSLDELNQKRNQAAKERNIEEGSKLKAEAEDLEKKFKEAGIKVRVFDGVLEMQGVLDGKVINI